MQEHFSNPKLQNPAILIQSNLLWKIAFEGDEALKTSFAEFIDIIECFPPGTVYFAGDDTQFLNEVRKRLGCDVFSAWENFFSDYIIGESFSDSLVLIYAVIAATDSGNWIDEPNLSVSIIGIQNFVKECQKIIGDEEPGTDPFLKAVKRYSLERDLSLSSEDVDSVDCEAILVELPENDILISEDKNSKIAVLLSMLLFVSLYNIKDFLSIEVSIEEIAKKLLKDVDLPTPQGLIAEFQAVGGSIISSVTNPVEALLAEVKIKVAEINTKVAEINTKVAKSVAEIFEPTSLSEVAAHDSEPKGNTDSVDPKSQKNPTDSNVAFQNTQSENNFRQSQIVALVIPEDPTQNLKSPSDTKATKSNSQTGQKDKDLSLPIDLEGGNKAVVSISNPPPESDEKTRETPEVSIFAPPIPEEDTKTVFKTVIVDPPPPVEIPAPETEVTATDPVIPPVPVPTPPGVALPNFSDFIPRVPVPPTRQEALSEKDALTGTSQDSSNLLSTNTDFLTNGGTVQHQSVSVNYENAITDNSSNLFTNTNSLQKIQAIGDPQPLTASIEQEAYQIGFNQISGPLNSTHSINSSISPMLIDTTNI